MNKPPLDPAVLSRILRLQTEIQTAPDNRSLSETVAKSLADLPGIAGCVVCFEGEVFATPPDTVLPEDCRSSWLVSRQPGDCRAERLADPARTLIDWRFTLQASGQALGGVYLRVAQPDVFRLYEPLLPGAVNLLALRIENRRQALELQALRNDLELQVAQRSASLQASEQRFALAMEATQDGLWDWNVTTGEVYYNPNYWRMLGYDPNELPSRLEAWADLIHPEDRARAISVNQDCIENRCQSFEVEFRLRTKDGGWKWVLGRGRAVERDAQGRALRMVGTHVDATARKLAEQTLESETARRRILFEQSPDGVLVIDPRSARFVEFNNAAHRQLGYSREEFAHLTIFDLEAQETTVETRERIASVLRSGRADFETLQRTRQGEIRNVHVTAQVVNVQGQPVYHCIWRDVTERKRALDALREERKLMETLLQSLPGIFYLYSYPELRLIRWNKNHETLLNFAPGEIDHRSIFDWHPPEAKELVRQAVEVVMQQGQSTIESPLLAKEGRPVPFLMTGVRLELNGQAYLMGVGMDLTARRRAEEEKEKLQAQLTHSQKMESVGRLAGGVAHDFNNMLQAILGNVSLALIDLPPGSPLCETFLEIQKCAERSADLTRQLLAFARKQTVTPKVLDLNETIEGMLKMLRRLIGEHIDLAWLPETNLGLVKMDSSQLDQILANLCVNARDAIGEAGQLTIKTGNVSFDEADVKDSTEVAVGDYVRLVVKDDGCGMDQETLAHLFEPFFTTKAVGKGTGLGLATVYGIVKQNGGFITVSSELNHGTTFNIHFRRYSEKVPLLDDEGAKQAAGGGPETILLVEDEPSILSMGRRWLEKLGYTVLAAATPGEAIQLAEQHPGRIHLLVTDVIMPEMNGRDLAKRLLFHHPDLKRLYMSGYTAEVIAHHGVLEEGIHFLQKPFTLASLASKVREALAT